MCQDLGVCGCYSGFFYVCVMQFECDVVFDGGVNVIGGCFWVNVLGVICVLFSVYVVYYGFCEFIFVGFNFQDV